MKWNAEASQSPVKQWLSMAEWSKALVEYIRVQLWQGMVERGDGIVLSGVVRQRKS